MCLFHLTKYVVPNDPPAQELLSFYKKKAYKKSELERIRYAMELTIQWEKNKIITLFPAVPDRQDYWYLVQLYFMDYHVHSDLAPYIFDWDKEEKLYVLDMFTRPQSRQDVDVWIKKNNDKILHQYTLDKRIYKLCLMPYDVYLRLSGNKAYTYKKQNIHFDGYRLRSDGKRMGLFGGNRLFGGASFIDSLWIDIINKSILTQLVIIRKDYGY